VTGHLVLSTIHTNSAAGTIARLLDMDVEPYMLSASLVGIIAQRLVRKICPVCKREITAHPADLKALGIPAEGNSIRFFEGAGCQNCGNTGTKSRMAVHEILVVNAAVRSLIPQPDASGKIRDYIKANRIRTIRDECIRLVSEGVISLKEAIEISFTQE